MEAKKILFVSPSVVYKKIVGRVLEELMPGAGFFCAKTESDALGRLDESRPFDIVIIDSAFRTIVGEEVFERLIAASGKAQKIVLCNPKEFENANRSSELHFIVKPIEEGYEENLRVIKRGFKEAIFEAVPAAAERRISDRRKYSLILIAASTGGPRAVEKVLTGLTGLNIPILVVQHMPAGFTHNFAEHVRKQYLIDMAEARNGDSLEAGRILLAPGGFHTKLDKNGKIALCDGEPVNEVKPSADVLFASVADVFEGEKICAIILTGMGADGTNGVRKLKDKCKCFCITQDEKSSTVYGMPRSVVEANLSDSELELGAIAAAVSEKVGE